MNVMLFSDSHGRVSYIEQMMARVLSVGAPPTQVLFLGDGLTDLARAHGLEGQSVVAVRGNCDGDAEEPLMREIGLGGYRALMLHGHTAGVKCDLLGAIGEAVRREADLLFYGHTHEPLARQFAPDETYMGVKIKKPLFVFNPGALKDGSFGRIEFNEKGILMSHGRLF